MTVAKKQAWVNDTLGEAAARAAADAAPSAAAPSAAAPSATAPTAEPEPECEISGECSRVQRDAALRESIVVFEE